MADLSVSEFASFCKERNPSCFIYATENQSSAQNPRMVLRFDSIIINLKPDRICFKNECDKMNIERVKFVRVYDDKPCVGTVLKIHCEGTDTDITLLMD